jgi:hypothetical protein
MVRVAVTNSALNRNKFYADIAEGDPSGYLKCGCATGRLISALVSLCASDKQLL